MSTGRGARELFDRSVATLVESWRYFATGSPGAEVVGAGGATVAVFVEPPEREFLNNAVLARGAADVGVSLDAIAVIYAERGVERYAVWLNESDSAAGREIEERGFTYDSSTRTMAMELADLAGPDTSSVELAEPDLTEFHRAFGMPAGLFARLSPAGAHTYLARLDGVDAASLMAFDHHGDCGIYNLGTVATARRRGLGTALTAHALVQARERGCTSASLQSTPMAEALYARLGFRDLGRFDEYVPIASGQSQGRG